MNQNSEDLDEVSKRRAPRQEDYLILITVPSLTRVCGKSASKIILSTLGGNSGTYDAHRLIFFACFTCVLLLLCPVGPLLYVVLSHDLCTQTRPETRYPGWFIRWISSRETIGEHTRHTKTRPWPRGNRDRDRDRQQGSLATGLTEKDSSLMVATKLRTCAPKIFSKICAEKVAPALPPRDCMSNHGAHALEESGHADLACRRARRK